MLVLESECLIVNRTIKIYSIDENKDSNLILLTVHYHCSNSYSKINTFLPKFGTAMAVLAVPLPTTLPFLF